MRIIGGKYKGHSIVAPKGQSTRPTTDRTRESLFNILSHMDGVKLENARILDLFAGSGALGLEAMSHGGSYCLFVDEASAARASIRSNIEALQLFGVTRIQRRSATALGRRPANISAPFDLVFLDPPYDRGLMMPALTSLLEGSWLSLKAICVAEQSVKEPELEVERLKMIDTRIYGDTRISFLQQDGAEG